MLAPRQAWYACGLAGLVWLLAATAIAAPGEDKATKEARAHLEQAKIHYKLREFDKAVAEFREAYRLKTVPALLFNIAQAERMDGNLKEAKFYYELYLSDVPDAPNRDEVLAQLAEIAKASEAEKSAAPPTKIVVAPVDKPAPIAAPVAAPLPPSAPPRPAPVAVAPPPPVVAPTPVAVAPPPRPAEPPVAAPVLTPPPAPAVVAVAPIAPVAAPLPEEPGGPVVRPMPKWPFVMVGLAVVAAGAGGYFGRTARTQHDGAVAAVYQDETAHLADDAQSSAMTANVLFAVAGLTAVAGGVGLLAW